MRYYIESSIFLLIGFVCVPFTWAQSTVTLSCEATLVKIDPDYNGGNNYWAQGTEVFSTTDKGFLQALQKKYPECNPMRLNSNINASSTTKNCSFEVISVDPQKNNGYSLWEKNSRLFGKTKKEMTQKLIEKNEPCGEKLEVGFLNNNSSYYLSLFEVIKIDPNWNGGNIFAAKGTSLAAKSFKDLTIEIETKYAKSTRFKIKFVPPDPPSASSASTDQKPLWYYDDENRSLHSHGAFWK